MRRWLSVLSVVVCALTMSGCATDLMGKKGEAMMAARYGDLERHALEEAPDMQRSKTVKLFPLCVAYAKQKKYNLAFPCFDQIEIKIKAGDTNFTDIEQMEKSSPLMMGLAKMGSAFAGISLEQDVTPFLYIMRSEAYMDIGDHDKAIADAKRAVDAKPNQWNMHKWHEINTTGVLTLAYALSGDREQAMSLAKRLEEVSTSYPHGLLAIDKHVWLAKTYVALGDFARALYFMEIQESAFDAFARGIADAMLGAPLRGESMWEFQMLPAEFLRYKCQFEVGRVDEARRGYDNLLAKPKIRDNGDIYWHILFDRGRIAERDGDAKAAVEYYRQAVEVIERQRSTISTETSKIGFVGDKQAVYRQLVVALLDGGQVAAAFDYVERSKSRALVDILAAKQDFAVRRGDPEKVRQLLEMVQRAESEALIQNDAPARTQKRAVIVGARQQLGAESPELASLINVSSLGSAEIQSLIPTDEALVEYYYSAPDLVAFVVSGKGLTAVRLDGAHVLENIRRYRQLIEQGKGLDSEALRLSGTLHGQLIGPLMGRLDVGKLIIVAHGPLHYLPFAALFDGQNYLIERYAFRMLPSASVLKYLRRYASEKAGNILALGNPDLGNPEYDLAFAQAEAIAVARSRTQSKALLRKEANVSALRELGGEFRYLHFATHGQFNAATPLQSALLLSRDEKSDGRLTVDALYSMALDADLVTLSACETGLGKVASGDDVVGLTRGFLYAGTSTVVASLWQVDDEATSYLMGRFYDNLKRMDKREALRRAQLETRRKFASPYYWAAFQLTGNAQ